MALKRSTVMFVLEGALHLIMAQAVRYLREASMPARALCRTGELCSAECLVVCSIFIWNCNLFLNKWPISCHKAFLTIFLHRSNSQLFFIELLPNEYAATCASRSEFPCDWVSAKKNLVVANILLTHTQEQAFFKLFDSFVQNVLK